MDFSVFSEIGPLEHVLVHEPGREIDEMPPVLMNEMLFDDILFGPKTRDEHRNFCKLIKSMGAKTHDFQTLLGEALATSEVERLGLIKLISLHESLGPETESTLIELAPVKLAEILIAGITLPEKDMEPDYLYELTPATNLFFSRDAQVVIGNKIAFSAMHSPARKRESLLSHFVFSHHPQFCHNEVLRDFNRSSLKRTGHVVGATTIEGGDILILNDKVIAVGVSERTSEQGVDDLVEALRIDGRWEKLVMVIIPASRAAMHLDTIFTQISEDECLVYAPMLVRAESAVSAITIELQNPVKDYGRRHASFMSAMKFCGIDLKPIYCGGQKSFIEQTREQWTDGANSFTLRPGMIIVYDRNLRTLEELDRAGYHVVQDSDLIESEDGKVALYDYNPSKKYALLLQSTELTRARGGPRCMTMPLIRKPL